MTTEEIVDNDTIRAVPQDTIIPYYLVDAVIEVPYGAHPTLMPGRYYFDEQHIGEWLRLSKTDEGAAEYFDRYVHDVGSFAEYLELIGGEDQLEYLRQVEHLEAPLEAPWLEEKRGSKRKGAEK
jgi:3-oxoacid CoA-transferase subunit A/glutaconate CoA-transferase subunit A